MEFLYKLFFEKHSGKDRIIVMIYTMTMCGFITQAFLAGAGYRLDTSNPVDLSVIIRFLFSKTALVVFLTFFVTFVLIYHLYLHFFLLVVSYVPMILLSPLRLLYMLVRKKRFRGVYSEQHLNNILSDLVFETRGEQRYRRKGQGFVMFKAMVQDMQHEGRMMDVFHSIVTVLFSTVVCLYLSGFDQPGFFLYPLYRFLYWTCIIFSVLGMFLVRLALKMDYLEEVLLSICNEEAPPLEPLQEKSGNEGKK